MISGLLEEFRVEFNIPLSLGLCLIENGEVYLIVSSPIDDELFFP